MTASAVSVHPAIEASGLCKSFGATRALDDVSLGFAAGAVHCLLGENGAGKSTLGKIVGGLYPADRGELRVDGRPMRFRSVADARRHGVAMVFQELSLAPDLSIAENICLGTEPGRFPLRPLPIRAEMARCRTLLDAVGLSDSPATRCALLSPPAQQLVEIAKALAAEPRAIVFDEPTSMLGTADKTRLLAIVRELRRRGLAVIFITHQIDEVMAIADRVSILRDGRLVASFDMDSAIDADLLVERLTGKRTDRRARAPAAPGGLALLRVATPPGAGGPRELVVHRGEIVALYGVVGCGRERLAHAVVGLDRPPDGWSMTLDGRAYAPGSPRAAARHGVSYLPTGRAANGILPQRSIAENLMLTQPRAVARLGILSARRERAAVSDQLARVRARDARPGDPIARLSGGNQQKILLGRALGRGGPLVVLEDPTAGVDLAAKDDIHRLIRRRAAEGVSFLLISSDLGESIALADTLHTVFDGALAGRHAAPVPADEPAIVAEILGGGGGTADHA